ncbi:MAG: hypothetical protein ABUM51_00320 [Bacteroidota bacterium]
MINNTGDQKIDYQQGKGKGQIRQTKKKIGLVSTGTDQQDATRQETKGDGYQIKYWLDGINSPRHKGVFSNGVD